MFNLSRPEKSLLLLAPLAKSAGGYGLCRTEEGNDAEVFRDRHDADYRRLLELCIEGRDHLNRIKRFDMPDFRPSDAYLREMRRFGVLDTPMPERIDPYALDETYWQLFWYHTDDEK
jgi:hypothetical protein